MDQAALLRPARRIPSALSKSAAGAPRKGMANRAAADRTVTVHIPTGLVVDEASHAPKLRIPLGGGTTIAVCPVNYHRQPRVTVLTHPSLRTGRPSSSSAIPASATRRARCCAAIADRYGCRSICILKGRKSASTSSFTPGRHRRRGSAGHQRHARPRRLGAADQPRCSQVVSRRQPGLSGPAAARRGRCHAGMAAAGDHRLFRGSGRAEHSH